MAFSYFFLVHLLSMLSLLCAFVAETVSVVSVCVTCRSIFHTTSLGDTNGFSLYSSLKVSISSTLKNNCFGIVFLNDSF